MRFNFDQILNEWIEKPHWLLDEAVSLIKGEVPQPPTISEFEKTNFKVFNFKTITYQKALKAINSKELNAIDNDEKWENGEPQFFQLNEYYTNESWFVEPKIFLKWCLNNEVEICRGLAKLYSYDYWIEQRYWSFNESVILLGAAPDS